MGKLNIFITGPPGSGKSTFLREVLKELAVKHVKLGGFITPEIRENKKRVGFIVKDVMSGEEKILAHRDIKSIHRISKYGISEDGLNYLESCLENGIKEGEVLIIDEIGPMELKSFKFKKLLKNAISSKKPLLATVHYRIKDSFIKDVGDEGEIRIYNIQDVEVKKIVDELLG